MCFIPSPRSQQGKLVDAPKICLYLQDQNIMSQRNISPKFGTQLLSPVSTKTLTHCKKKKCSADWLLRVT